MGFYKTMCLAVGRLLSVILYNNSQPVSLLFHSTLLVDLCLSPLLFFSEVNRPVRNEFYVIYIGR